MVGLLERIQGMWNRLSTYAPWDVAVELVAIWIVVYIIVRFVQGTRAAGALKGLLVLLVLVTIVSRLLAGSSTLQRLSLLHDKFLAFVAIALIVIFQPELRRALVRLGETSFLRNTPKDIAFIVDEVAEAAKFLSRARFGALMVLERSSKLGGLVEGGTRLNAELSSRLIQSIFFPGSALHDLAIVIKGRVVESAGVQLPLADPQDMPDASLGSRHRAALGLAQECDAVVVVVSEETGGVRIAERGRLSEPLSDAQLREELSSRLTRAYKRVDADVAPASAAELAERREEQREQRREEQRDDQGSMSDSASGDSLAGASMSGSSVAGESHESLAGGQTAAERSLGDTMMNEALATDQPVAKKRERA